jgi:hypothetical protein
VYISTGTIWLVIFLAFLGWWFNKEANLDVERQAKAKREYENEQFERAKLYVDPRKDEDYIDLSDDICPGCLDEDCVDCSDTPLATSHELRSPNAGSSG